MATRIDAPLRRRLTALDSSFLYLETPVNPLHIGSLAFYEGHLSFEKLLDFVAKRIHLVPRYRQRLAEVPLNLGHPTLEDDPNFRIENHVKRYSLPEGLNKTEMIGEVLKLYHAQMDRRRPLWDMMHFGEWPGGKTLVVWRVHHALIDGVSGVELAKILSDFVPDAPDPTPPDKAWNPTPLPGLTERLFAGTRDSITAQVESVTQAGLDLVGDPVEVIRRARKMMEAMVELADLTRPMAITPWTSGPVGNDRSLAWIITPFSEYRAIRNKVGGTVNDIVLTVLSEGAARYLAHHRYPSAGYFRIGCPVNVRRPEEQTDLGNRVSMMFPMVPAAPTNSIERLKAVRAETEKIKVAELPQSMERFSSLMELAPAGIMYMMSRAGTSMFDIGASLVKIAGWKPRPRGLLMPALGVHFVATNVPGVQVPLYTAGHRCLDSVGLFPLAGSIGYGVAIGSYDQNMCIAMIADPNLLPDINRMKAFVEEAFDDLRKAADEADSQKATHGSGPANA